jgi:hypothetical protein
MRKYLFFPVVFMMLTAFGPRRASLNVSVDKKEVKVGETFKYQIEVKGNFRMSPEIIFPKLDNFRILSQQRVFNIRVGKKGLIADSKNIFILVPLKEGEFEIKGVKIKLGWKEYNVPAVKITVKGVKEIPQIPQPEEKPGETPSGEGIWI